MTKKLKFAILKNEIPEDEKRWIDACVFHSEIVDYELINFVSDKWLEEIMQSDADVFLAKPGGINSLYKQMYDEKIAILDKNLRKTIFPSPDEIFIYENKRFLSYWLKSNDLPHPKTNIFYDKNECVDFISNSPFPVVAKTNIGASGSGVVILKEKSQAIQYINDVFSSKGAAQRIGINFKSGNLLKRALKILFNPSKLGRKMKIYSLKKSSIQRNYVIFQEFVPHTFEWRVVRIGDSFFAHKKLLKGDKTSGSLLKGYENPPLSLLSFVKEITDRFSFYSQAVDIFEQNGQYLINEMQCIFGQSDPYQMLVDGEQGRYVFINDEWVFEKGVFNENESYNLRIEYLIQKYLK